MAKKELHIISTGQQPIKEFVSTIASIHDYVDYIHIREKTKTAKEIFDTVMYLTENKIPLSKIIINDRVDVAAVTRVAGVQLGYSSLDVESVKSRFPELKIGCSIHSKEEAIAAEKNGANFCLFGHIYSTKSKPGIAPRGITGLTEVVSTTNLPVIAIGGIQPQSTLDVIEAGAAGIAVLSGVLLASNPLGAVKEYAYKLGREGVHNEARKL
ncbi:thiazole tautomerase TenI [Bacillus luteolus]|uniref:Thiazole tautomerase TenI n=1 Tax=Litchfieldia luteola TaxID=682179 RepID=A0ABR9QE82_9BACI|nr:thiazole tautomerase TenI [Cytobacillus luteolus]MBE4906798.1 thiazole tautomerase TenI [Cytobacillus luteolus]MBP1940548.1 thiazole tautomerase (transcriptional regulator TenI) [Cytobacillus luteolus]